MPPRLEKLALSVGADWHIRRNQVRFIDRKLEQDSSDKCSSQDGEDTRQVVYLESPGSDQEDAETAQTFASLSKLDISKIGVISAESAASHYMPSTLYSLSIPYPVVVLEETDLHTPKLYPLLDRSPLLQTLDILAFNIPYSKSLFPSTLTELSLDFADGASGAFDQILSDLPNIRRLHLHGIIFPLRHILHRLPSLDQLVVDNYAIHAEILPQFDEGVTELSPDTIAAHCLSKLFPPHLRQRGSIEFYIEWNPVALQKLPSTLTRARFESPIPNCFAVPHVDLGSVLPAHLQHLDIGSYVAQLSTPVTSFPHCVESLTLTSNNHPSILGVLRALPSILCSLQLILAENIIITPELFRLLLRSLQRLDLRASMELWEANSWNTFLRNFSTSDCPSALHPR